VPPWRGEAGADLTSADFVSPRFAGALALYARALELEHRGERDFKGLAASVQELDRVLGALEGFLLVFCGGSQAQGVWACADQAAHLADLRAVGQGLPELPVRMVRVAVGPAGGADFAAFWGRLAAVRDPALAMAGLVHSTFAANAWNVAVPAWCRASGVDEEGGVTVAALAGEVRDQALRVGLGGFVHECNEGGAALPVQRVAAMLRGVREADLRRQLDLLADNEAIIGRAPGGVMHDLLLDFMRLEETGRFAAATAALVRYFECDPFSDELLALAGSVTSLFEDAEAAGAAVAGAVVEAVRAFRAHVEGVWDVMPLVVELAQCPALLDFAREIKDEQYLNLIDQVEEHGESFISAQTVSDLDVIRRLLRPVFRAGGGPGEGLLAGLRGAALAEAQGGGGAGQWLGDVARRVGQCRQHVHGLRDMYRRMSNRQELTKATVARLLDHGSFRFARAEAATAGLYEVSVVWQNLDGNDQRLDASKLEDLKGRALLQVCRPSRGARVRSPFTHPI
jgi:hypothetical protein